MIHLPTSPAAHPLFDLATGRRRPDCREDADVMTQFQQQDDRARMARKRLMGMILMTVGGLMALLRGLCTLAIGVAVMTYSYGASPPPRAFLSSFLTPLIVGGPPTAVGVVLFRMGRGMYREGAARLGHAEKVFD